MDFNALRLVVAQDRCVGCGMCEQICKTVNDRIAIKVVPARNLAAGALGYVHRPSNLLKDEERQGNY